MVWDRGSEPLVVPTRWALLRVALGGAPVGPCSAAVGFTERSVGKSLRVTYDVYGNISLHIVVSTGIFELLADCQCILHRNIILLSE